MPIFHELTNAKEFTQFLWRERESKQSHCQQKNNTDCTENALHSSCSARAMGEIVRRRRRRLRVQQQRQQHQQQHQNRVDFPRDRKRVYNCAGSAFGRFPQLRTQSSPEKESHQHTQSVVCRNSTHIGCQRLNQN